MIIKASVQTEKVLLKYPSHNQPHKHAAHQEGTYILALLSSFIRFLENMG